jgi:hypothetical protein
VSSHRTAPMRSSEPSCSARSSKSIGKKWWRSRKKSNTRCSSIICARAVADRTSSGDGEFLSAQRSTHSMVNFSLNVCKISTPQRVRRSATGGTGLKRRERTQAPDPSKAQGVERGISKISSILRTIRRNSIPKVLK